MTDDLKLDKEFFKDLEGKRSRGELAELVNPYAQGPYPQWPASQGKFIAHEEITDNTKIAMNKHDIVMCIDNLKELNVPRNVVIRFLIREIKNIFGDK